MAPRKWTRQIVIERIQSLHQQGIPAGKIYREDRNLCMVSYALFGSWRAALKEAGFESVRRTWTREQVLVELKAEYIANTTRRRHQRKQDSRLNASAVRYFGTRRKALIAAGITRLEPSKTKRSWNPSQVIAAIVERHEKGLSLTNVWKEDVRLLTISKRTFGSWSNALKAAGLSSNKPRKQTREELLQTLREMHKNRESFVGLWSTDQKFYGQIKTVFGNLQIALAEANLPTQRKRSWTKRVVVEAIQSREKNGPNLSRVWQDDRPLFHAAVNHFGNWQSALSAAGVKFKERQRWTKENVLERLRHTYRGERNFYEIYPALVGAAHRFFGGLLFAVEAAGLDLPCGKWSKRRIIQQIQEYYVQGHRLEINGFGDLRFALAAKRYFGTWRKAVSAAGLESRLAEPNRTRNWSGERVLETIRSISESDEKVSKAWKQDSGLYSAAKKHFGSWREAVLAAGCKPARRRWSKELVVTEIQERHRRGLALNSEIFKQDPPLAGAALRLFGNWRSALAGAGIEEPEIFKTTDNSKRQSP